MKKRNNYLKMNNSTDWLEDIMDFVRTKLRIWLQFFHSRQPMSTERPPQYLVIAVFISVVIHAFLASLLWVVISRRIAVEPADDTIDTPLILSLSRFTNDSHDGIDLEVVSAVPHTDRSAQRSQSSPEPSRSTERKSETETVVTSKDQNVLRSEDPEDKSLATDATASFDQEAANRMTWDFGFKPELKVETVMISVGHGIPGSETPGSISLVACLTSSFGLEAVSCIDREFGRISESEVQDIRIKSSMLYMKTYRDETRAWRLRHNCRTAYAGAGLFAIPLLLKDAITGNGCKWEPVIEE